MEKSTGTKYEKRSAKIHFFALCFATLAFTFKEKFPLLNLSVSIMRRKSVEGTRQLHHTVACFRARVSSGSLVRPGFIPTLQALSRYPAT